MLTMKTGIELIAEEIDRLQLSDQNTIKNCVHKWKYLSGSPQNELHQCLKCGTIA